MMNAKCIAYEKENESLIQRTASVAMNVQEREESLRDKEDKIDSLEAMHEAAQREIEDIK